MFLHQSPSLIETRSQMHRNFTIRVLNGILVQIFVEFWTEGPFMLMEQNSVPKLQLFKLQGSDLEIPQTTGFFYVIYPYIYTIKSSIKFECEV